MKSISPSNQTTFASALKVAVLSLLPLFLLAPNLAQSQATENSLSDLPGASEFQVLFLVVAAVGQRLSFWPRFSLAAENR